MKKYDIIIAIDPDVEKSGVAELSTQNRLLDVTSLSFPELLDYLQERKRMSGTVHASLVVVVEAGWINSISNYHTAADRKGQRIAKNVGANHETGRKIIEMCRYYGIEVVEQPPLRKCWKGVNKKITQSELDSLLLSRKIEVHGKRISQDCRDAVLLALYHSNIL